MDVDTEEPSTADITKSATSSNRTTPVPAESSAAAAANSSSTSNSNKLKGSVPSSHAALSKERSRQGGNYMLDYHIDAS